MLQACADCQSGSCHASHVCELGRAAPASAQQLRHTASTSGHPSSVCRARLDAEPQRFAWYAGSKEKLAAARKHQPSVRNCGCSSNQLSKLMLQTRSPCRARLDAEPQRFAWYAGSKEKLAAARKHLPSVTEHGIAQPGLQSGEAVYTPWLFASGLTEEQVRRASARTCA